MNTLTLQELQSRLADLTPPTLVEALPARYFEQWHLPHAINLNIGDVKEKAHSLLPDFNAPIIIYCASITCTNSDQVAMQLTTMGYRNVAVYKGGKEEWEAAGLSKIV